MCDGAAHGRCLASHLCHVRRPREIHRTVVWMPSAIVVAAIVEEVPNDCGNDDGRGSHNNDCHNGDAHGGHKHDNNNNNRTWQQKPVL